MSDEVVIQFVKKKFGKVDAIVDVYTMQFLHVSKKYAKIAGYTQKELIGVSARRLFHFSPLQIVGLVGEINGYNGATLARNMPLINDQRKTLFLANILKLEESNGYTLNK